jgi:hypothetical protein
LAFSVEQERVVRDLIQELKWHLSKFSEEQEESLMQTPEGQILAAKAKIAF